MTRLDDVLGRLKSVKKVANGYMAKCPTHEDDKQSLSVTEVNGKVLMKCFAGCETELIVDAIGMKMKDLFEGTGRTIVTFDLEIFAQDKGIPSSFLISNGLSNLNGGVEIQYLDLGGERSERQRLRKDNVAGVGSIWMGTKGVSPVPYGLWHIEGYGKAGHDYLLLTEGESDALTAWFHGIPALGMPGADMAKILEIDHISNFRKLYVLVEPDKGGKTFLKGITKRVKELGWQGDVYSLKMPHDLKDLNDLHRYEGDFKQQFFQCIGAARKVREKVIKDPVVVKGFNLTDYGNAQRLVSGFGGDIRYCYQWNKWIIWDEIRWKIDNSGAIYRKAKMTVMRIYGEAAIESDDASRRALRDHAMKSESSARLGDMIKLAQSEPGISITPDKLNQDQWLFNVKNGTIDLRTGELREHRREDMITKLSDVHYDPGAKCRDWLKFMLQIMDKNKDLVRFIQRAMGYGMTGNVSEQVLFFLYGTGANGKSVLLELILAILGDYAKTSEPELLMSKRNESHPTGVADLHGVRFVSSIEVGDGKRLNETLLKQLTGSDSIKARFMRQDFFEFNPTHKIFLAANHKPSIRGTDYAIWRRIRLIPFRVKFQKPNKHMAEELKANLSGILTWAVQGCVEWVNGGLKETPEVMSEVSKYQQEMDVIGGFISDCCVILDFAKGTSAALYGKYKEWCGVNGEYAVSKRKFGISFVERGYLQERGTGGERWWRGVGLVSENDDFQSSSDASDALNENAV